MAIAITLFMGVRIPEEDRSKEYFRPDWLDGQVPESVSSSEEGCNERMNELGYREGEYFIVSEPMLLKWTSYK
jgi:hypothetical protein